jgi:hypothetical protein
MRIIDNEGNPIRVESFEEPIAPSNKQLALEVERLTKESHGLVKSMCSNAGNIGYLLSQVERMQSQLAWLNGVTFFFWCCLVLYWAFS